MSFLKTSTIMRFSAIFFSLEDSSSFSRLSITGSSLLLIVPLIGDVVIMLLFNLIKRSGENEHIVNGPKFKKAENGVEVFFLNFK